MKIKKVRHTGIVVSDIEKSIRFYTELLGLKIEKDMLESGAYIDNFSDLVGAEVRTVKMSLESGDMVELLHYKSPRSIFNTIGPINTVGCSHIALTVDNLDEVYNTFLDRGVKFNSPPQYSPDGFAKVTFCKDPDGVLIELVEELG